MVVPQRRSRNLVIRADGKTVNVVRKQGHLFVCATGCCCGRTERSFPPIPTELYHNEWERRKLRNRIHLTIGGCLGPCTLFNVAMLMFDGRSLWFHSVNSDGQVLALYDYMEQLLAANSYVPPPPALTDNMFTSFAWDEEPRAAGVQANRAGGDAESAAPAVIGGGGFLVLTQADTDLLAFQRVAGQLPSDFPPLHVVNPSHLRNDADLDIFLDDVLPRADVIIVRLLGGRASFRHGLDRIVAWAQEQNVWLICLPGTDALDPELAALSTTGVPVAHEAFAYLQMGGVRNYVYCLRFLADHLLAGGFGYDAPEPQPRHGLYHPDIPEPTVARLQARHSATQPTIGVLFYRSHLLSGNTAFADAIVRACEAGGLNVLPVYTYSLKEGSDEQEATANALPAAVQLFLQDGRPAVDVIINTTSFAMGSVNPDGPTPSGWSVTALTQLDVPMIQAITASSTRPQWEASDRGLSPLDTAMNVVIPEFDGRIIGVPVSFKEQLGETRGVSSPARNGEGTATPAVYYAPDAERIAHLVGLAARLAVLRRKPNADKRVAFVLTNSAAKASRIGNAVGLDAPASLLRLFAAMQQAGYRVEGVPESGDALLHALIDRCSYDAELLTPAQLAQAAGQVHARQYGRWYEQLPAKNQQEMGERWGAAPGSAYVHDGRIALAGLELGNVFVALQPPRGYGMDPNLIYHMPDLPPPHHYHALYRWLRDPAGWGADAIVHVGKHGTLEWLPGKSIGPAETCYPDQFLGDLPLIYPFIINNPGEGAQAKRRTHAVIVDHMTPPMTTAGGYAELAELAQLVDEYYQVEQLDPSKLPLLQQQIWELLKKARLDADLKVMLTRSHDGHSHAWDDELTEDGTPVAIAELRGKDFAHLLEDIDGYLCELTGAQIRDGLHTLGEVPTGEQLTDLLQSLTRIPNLEIPSLRAGVAAALGLSLDALLDAPGKRLEPDTPAEADRSGFASHADALEAVDALCHRLLAGLQQHDFAPEAVQSVLREVLMAPFANEATDSAGRAVAAGCPDQTLTDDIAQVLQFVCGEIVPRLRQNQAEIDNVLHALAGGYVPAGPSGAPTRGMAHVLPTGRNFYAVDPRTLPSLAAWRVGSQLAEELLQRHRKEEGRYPEQVGLSIWGTSAMRTHGDDIAEVFALLGVRPRWQAENRRLLGIQPMSLEELGRPRIDVVCRISGFFRDAFPHLISLMDEAVRTVANLDEPPEQNFLRKRYLADQARHQQAGLAPEAAAQRAGYRIFGCKPGTYGAGILPLIDEKNWQDVHDFAEAYVNWGGYAYTATEYGTDARDAFREQLATVAVAVKNQDNREHDIFDSDDYLQYHGGMIATIRALSGKAPRRYFGDSSDPQRARVRDLKEEALRVFRSRVVNPKWIASMQRHGYKGALEMAATVDYLFGYDATSDVVDDWMYDRTAGVYALDPAVQAFFRASNPWALRDVAERLLEAIDRGLWAKPDPERRAQLRDLFLSVEGDLEGRGSNAG